MAVTISSAVSHVDGTWEYVEIKGTFTEVFEEISKRTKSGEPDFRVIFKGHENTVSSNYKYVLAYKK